MRLNSKTAAIASCLAFAALPAIAGADKPTDPGDHGQGQAVKPDKGQHGQGHSKRCKKPTVAKGYVVSGTYDAGPFTPYTAAVPATDPAPATEASPGSVTFTITHTNHPAKDATSPISFTTAKVRFDSPTATGPVAGDHVTVIGKILVAKKNCSSDTAGQVTIRKIVFSAPEPADDPGTET